MMDDPESLVQRLKDRADKEGHYFSDADLFAEAAQRIQDHEECDANHRNLVRELDVLLNGEVGAAKQAALCDIVSQFAREMSGMETTDMAKRLIRMADDCDSEASLSDRAQLRCAAYELDRYYKGMLAWKRTAEAKDKK